MSDDEPVRDLTSALRFLQVAVARQREDHERVDATLEALMAALIEAQVITDEAIDDHLLPASRTARQRRPEELSVRLWSGDDKYGIPDPGIDCEARMHLCQGRCCSFEFPLSEQDLDEGQVRWRHHQPYMIAQRPDGYCVHNDPATRGCGVYAHRPGTCRQYSCRTDKRVWIDFEARIPAPLDARPRLIEIRRPAKKLAP
ncbi:MAG: YkgJ family cysteine cluster protein [Myxococcales bacterium]|nr:YkgJ family cysteine cluster protein [Myxococcales bacterium]MBK7194361.1 YkgJ family cysteine cluster protein [Myxococcales bacterium]